MRVIGTVVRKSVVTVEKLYTFSFNKVLNMEKHVNNNKYAKIVRNKTSFLFLKHLNTMRHRFDKS